MIILENVKNEDNIIKGDYHLSLHDSENEWGHFEFDIKSDSYKKIVYCKEHQKAETKYGMCHMTRAIHQMIECNNYPERVPVLWY